MVRTPTLPRVVDVQPMLPTSSRQNISLVSSSSRLFYWHSERAGFLSFLVSRLRTYSSGFALTAPAVSEADFFI
jgi:hypothetical protein